MQILGPQPPPWAYARLVNGGDAINMEKIVNKIIKFIFIPFFFPNYSVNFNNRDPAAAQSACRIVKIHLAFHKKIDNLDKDYSQGISCQAKLGTETVSIVWVCEFQRDSL